MTTLDNFASLDRRAALLDPSCQGGKVTYSGTCIADMIATVTRIPKDEVVAALDRAQIALADHSDDKGELKAADIAAYHTLERLKDLVAEDLGQCWWETIETSKGACDGGERCTDKATREINGMAFCAKHFSDELIAHCNTLIVRAEEVIRAGNELEEMN